MLHNTIPQLPDLQVAVWTEPLHGLKVFPIKVGAGALDVCTVNLPLDATPHEAAIHVALHCAGLDRLQYHIAHGHRVLCIEGRAAAPFVAWQLAMADCGIMCASPAAASSRATAALVPAEMICPTQVEEALVLQYGALRSLFTNVAGLLLLSRLTPALAPNTFWKGSLQLAASVAPSA